MGSVFYIQVSVYHMNENTMSNLKIAQSLAKSPDCNLLRLAKTIDQLQEWLESRRFQQLLALAWISRRRVKDNPLDSLRETNRISKVDYKIIWLLVNFYDALWALIQIAFPYIQPELKRFGFSNSCNSASDLFCSVIASIPNEDFSNCLEPYKEVSNRKIVKHFRLIVKVHKGEASPEMQKQAQKKYGKYNSTFLELIINICCVKGKGRFLVENQLEAFFLAALNFGEQAAKKCWNEPSFVWSQGQKSGGSSNGDYSP